MKMRTVNRTFDISSRTERAEDGEEVEVYDATSSDEANHLGVDCNSLMGSGFTPHEAMADWARQATVLAQARVEALRAELSEAETYLRYWKMERDGYRNVNTK